MFEISRNKGFTIIELVVVIAIISVLSGIVLININQYIAKSRDAIRASALKEVQKALLLYYVDHGSYPNTGGIWRSECPAYGGYVESDVIPGLEPDYIGNIPSDSAMNKTDNTCCYLYESNGIQYDFLFHNCPGTNYASQPSLIDPARDGGSDPCVVDGDGTHIWAWRVSSPGRTCP